MNRDKDRMHIRVAVAQIGARRRYAVPRALHKAGLLCAFYTDACVNIGLPRLLDAVLPRKWRKGGLGRLLDRDVGVPSRLIETFSGLALLKSTEGIPMERSGLVEFWLKQNSRFCRCVAGTSLREADAIYAFNGAALEIFQKARRLGMRTILDQSSAPLAVEERLLEEERAAWPEFDSGGARNAATDEFIRREREELNLADTILCGSEYVRDCVMETSGGNAPVQLVPYGICQAPASTEPRLRRHPREFHILFAGTVHLMKGVQYLAEAARILKGRGFVFRLVGSVRTPGAAVARLKECAEVFGPVPRLEMRRQYNWADILVHPTLSEGSSNVCFEGLAEGLPVITTRNAGSVVRDRSDGYIVPIRSADALVERIAQLAGDIDLLSGMSRNALERASEFTPDGYARRLALAVRTVSSERGTRNEEKGKGQGVSGKRMERMKAET
jgi:glycosyltransferase involved in cell wall biosynthesis